MRIRGVALVIISLTLLFSSTLNASAEPTPSPEYQLQMTQYKLELNQYHDLVEARDKARLQINRTFMLAVNEVNREARTAMKLAKTVAAKNEILSNQKIAVTAASIARDAAIAALGAPPTPPIKPIRPLEMTSLNKMKGKKPSPSPTR